MLPLLLDLIRRNWALIAAILTAFSVGWAGAWHLRSLAVVEIEQEFKSYQQHIKAQEIQAAERAEAARMKSAEDYRRAKDELAKEIEAREVYKRCVDAGKCGRVRVEYRDCGASLRVPPGGIVNAASANPVSSPGGPAEEMSVVNECAVTTLQLNKLQEAIERQDGY